MVMFKMAEGRLLVVWAFVFVYNADISSADVSSTDCTSVGNQCDTIHDASCDTSMSSPKCKCDEGFKENTDTCAAKGLGDSCTVVTDCKAVANSKCATTCVCADGYTKINNACVKGLTDTCSADSDCSAVKNAECDTTCKCSIGYKANGATCVLAVSSTTCTSGGNECDAIGNAQCDMNLLKCKCDQGYKENKDACEAIESGAVSMKSAVGLVFGSMILLLIQAL